MSNTWRGAVLKAFVIQIGLIAALSLGWFGFLDGFGGADNPLWFYVAAVLQFPASLIFTTALKVLAKARLSDVRSVEVAGMVVALVQFALLAIVIKKIRDSWSG